MTINKSNARIGGSFAILSKMTVVGAIIINQQGEFLLQQRDDKATSFKNCWTLFGGIVESGETPKQAVLRELQEELDLSAQKITSIIHTQTNIQQNGTKQVIYVLRTGAQLGQLTLTEGKIMAYIPVSELFERMYAFNIREVLSDFITNKLI